MKEEKLELNHIFPYLDYGLKCEILDYKCDYVGKRYDTIIGYETNKSGVSYIFSAGYGNKKTSDTFIPLLRPMSDLIKVSDVGGGYEACFINDIQLFFNESDYQYCRSYIDNKQGVFSIRSLTYGVVQQLLEWHFDVFGLIEKGLAKDINEFENVESMVSWLPLKSYTITNA